MGVEESSEVLTAVWAQCCAHFYRTPWNLSFSPCSGVQVEINLDLAGLGIPRGGTGTGSPVGSGCIGLESCVMGPVQHSSACAAPILLTLPAMCAASLFVYISFQTSQCFLCVTGVKLSILASSFGMKGPLYKSLKSSLNEAVLHRSSSSTVQFG